MKGKRATVFSYRNCAFENQKITLKQLLFDVNDK